MENVSVEITPDEILVLRVDLKQMAGLTNGGRNVRIASSLGNVPLPTKDGGLRPERFNLNVFRARSAKEKLTEGVNYTIDGEAVWQRT
jgi:hypothetical protein